MNVFKIGFGFFLLLACFIIACTSLTTIDSLPTEELSETSKFPNYDNKGKISYGVYNDSMNIYIKLMTADRSAIKKILHGGLYIYFDTCGKKKKNTFIQYPLPKSSPLRQTQGLTLSEQLLFLPKEAIFKNDNKQHTFNPLSTTDSIQVNITSGAANQLSYHLKIPFGCISKTGLQGCRHLSIGIETGKLSVSEQTHGRPANSSSSSLRQGKGRGHLNGPRSGKGRQITANSQPNRNTNITAIEIWHKISLK